MFPKKDTPVVAMSINSNLNPAYHIKVGQVISTLKDSDDILFIGIHFFNRYLIYFIVLLYYIRNVCIQCN